MLFKTAIREISKSKGKFFAILAIVALGVGFFCGLKETRPAIIKTGETYLEETSFHDLETISNVGWDSDAVKEVKKIKGVKYAEGRNSLFCMGKVSGDKKEKVYRIIAMTDDVDKVKLVKGKRPKNENECLIDMALSEDGKLIGKTFTVKNEKKDGEGASEEADDRLENKKFKITGTCTSPMYLNGERGKTEGDKGDKVTGFIYVDRNAFSDPEVYSEIVITSEKDYPLFSSEYNKHIKKLKSEIKKKTELIAEERYDTLKADALEEAKEEAKKKALESLETMEPPQGIPASMMASYMKQAKDEALAQAEKTAREEVEKAMPKKSKTWLLTREENEGYVCFDNDTEIIEKVAIAFPVFFILIAALVSITTMARIIDEQRTLIGTLKALGYSSLSVLDMYLIYSLSATLTGGIIGFFAGVLSIPQLIWSSYTCTYKFNKELEILLNPKLGILVIAVTALLSIATTVYSAASNMKEVPAELIRPKVGVSGKRILLEYADGLWQKLSLLWRISLRNTFRYKGRLLMMIVGVSGCMALLVTGFGLKDSVKHAAGDIADSAHVQKTIDSLSSVTGLIIISAGILAFIVIYNLTNINIAERIREIATVKVLGFHQNETAIYIFRENFCITGISVITGAILGKFLHTYVVKQIETEYISFDPYIAAESYVWSVILTFAFACIVMAVMYFKLNNIKMAESLKSIE